MKTKDYTFEGDSFKEADEMADKFVEKNQIELRKLRSTFVNENMKTIVKIIVKVNK